MTPLSLAIDVALWSMIAATAFIILAKARLLFFQGSTKLLQANGAGPHELADRMESLESGMTLLAVISSTAAFVGLAGTVLHIVAALSSMKGSALDIGVISGPIATALYATLLGLASAIPASAAYNLFLRRLQLIEARAERSFAKRQLPGHDGEGAE